MREKIIAKLICLTSCIFVLSGCAENYLPLPTVAADKPYLLDSGDKVRVIVYGDQSMSQEYNVGSDGTISMPMIGPIKAKNLTAGQLQQDIAQRLRKGVYASPGVSAEVIEYRPFYITGEVAKPGAYPYAQGLTVLSAVAIAGGFTIRAEKNDMLVDRARSGEQGRYAANPLSRIQPGDVITIPERIF